MICLDAQTLRYYRVTKRYDSNGSFIERTTGRRYSLIKRWI